MVGGYWQISDELWEKLAPLIPEHKTNHPLGTYRKRVDNRAVMNVIFLRSESVARLNKLNVSGICLSSTVHCCLRE
ncbi:transposase [Providencia rettgeri]|uniref:Insertion element IS402-like domain-containing protein n=1 Tax=Providencia rettgeri TaxID=587 RepID=A0A379FX78_PRORE|nr:transposase [Providencia rettgeri]SUC32973.1 Uncharacterised protein [Providencia rettgeri]